MTDKCGSSHRNQAAFSTLSGVVLRGPKSRNTQVGFYTCTSYHVYYDSNELASQSQANTLFSVVFGRAVLFHNLKLITNSKPLSLPTTGTGETFCD